MHQKYNRIIDGAVMELFIEKSHNLDKPQFYDGFSADWAPF